MHRRLCVEIKNEQICIAWGVTNYLDRCTGASAQVIWHKLSGRMTDAPALTDCVEMNNEQICIAWRVTSYMAGRMTVAQNDRYMLVVLRLKQGENIHCMGR